VKEGEKAQSRVPLFSWQMENVFKGWKAEGEKQGSCLQACTGTVAQKESCMPCRKRWRPVHRIRCRREGERTLRPQFVPAECPLPSVIAARRRPRVRRHIQPSRSCQAEKLCMALRYRADNTARCCRECIRAGRRNEEAIMPHARPACRRSGRR